MGVILLAQCTASQLDRRCIWGSIFPVTQGTGCLSSSNMQEVCKDVYTSAAHSFKWHEEPPRGAACTVHAVATIEPNLEQHQVQSHSLQ